MISARHLAFLLVPSLVLLACNDHSSLYAIDGGGGDTTSTTTGSSNTGGSGGSTNTTSSSTTSSTTTTSSSNTGGSGGSTTTSTSSNSGGSGGSTTTSSTSGTGGAAPARVRVAAANLTSGNGQSYDPGHGIRILEGIRADVLLMQEMNYGTNTPAKLRQLVDQVCGTECYYARGSGAIPNGVVSRHPIVASGSWVDPNVSNRDFVWARIDVPGPIDLWAVSLHLLTSNATERNAEAASLIAQLQANVPTTDYLVVGGDLNTDNRSESALSTLGARLSVAGPYPADGMGNDNTSGPRSRPYDWNLASPALRLLETPVLIGAAHFDAGLVVDTRVYTPLADISPALQNDSGASGMQHMAVVRDFVILP